MSTISDASASRNLNDIIKDSGLVLKTYPGDLFSTKGILKLSQYITVYTILHFFELNI